MNHDFGSMESEDLLKAVESNSCKSVFVGHDNLLDQSFADELQKFPKTLPFKVDTTPNIGIDVSVFGVKLDKVVALTHEIFLLFGRGDSCVDNDKLS